MRLIDYGVASRCKEKSGPLGDFSLVREMAGAVLIAVGDGLGHGPEAAHAARTAIGALEAAGDRPVDRLIEDCHAALIGTRGVVMALAVIDPARAEMIWVAVGNVEGRVVRRAANGARERHSLVMHSGILGHRLPPLRPARLALRGGDLVAFATDGIAAEFDDGVRLDRPPQAIADDLLLRYGKTNDDALILVGRWIGSDAAA